MTAATTTTPKTVRRLLECRLTKEDRLDGLARLQRALSEQESRELEVESAAEELKRLKSAAKEAGTDVRRISHELAVGIRRRMVDCEVWHDYQQNRAIVVRTDTGEVVQVRALLPEERQQTLDQGTAEASDEVRAKADDWQRAKDIPLERWPEPDAEDAEHDEDQEEADEKPEDDEDPEEDQEEEPEPEATEATDAILDYEQEKEAAGPELTNEEARAFEEGAAAAAGGLGIKSANPYPSPGALHDAFKAGWTRTAHAAKSEAAE